MLKFKILSVDEAKIYIEKKDLYLEYITPFYINQILKNKDAQHTDFIENLKNSCVDPKQKSESLFKSFEEKINLSLKELKISINETINIIFTNGQDNINLPYTKGKAIILPMRNIGINHYSLIIHEIWHIISRNNKKIRLDAYKSIGWKYKENLLDKVIITNEFINPDACHHDHYIRIPDVLGNYYNVTPIMLNSCFDEYFIIFNDSLKFLKIDRMSNFTSYKKLWKNTSYNNHPEEICAEHFMLLLTNSNIVDKEIMKSFYFSLTENLGI